MECIFCAIVDGDVEASPVYQDEQILAFLDIRPIKPGHTLVIPKDHASDLADLPAPLAGRMMQVALKVAAGLYRTELKCDGINLWLADGASAGQEVFHTHLHVLPRFQGDGFGFRLPQGYGTLADREELDGMAAALRAAL